MNIIKAQKWADKNILWIFLIIIFFVLGIAVKTAWATQPKNIKMSNQKAEQYLIAKPALTTTSTAPKPPEITGVTREAPSSVEVENAAQFGTPSISYDQGSVEQMIVDSANRHGLDPQRMLRIAKCESGLNPGSVAPNLIDGTHPTGLYQHVAKYWPARAAKYGFEGASIFDANAQVEVTMAMFRDGGAGAWACH